MECFWCGKRIYLYYTVIEVGTLEHKMHDGPIQDCADQYNEWHNQPTYIGGVAEYHTSMPR